MIDYAGRFKKLVEAVGYELLGEYKGSITKVKIRCKKGHAYSVQPNAFKQGNRCPICSNKCPIQSKERFIELVKKEKYELLSEYKGNKNKVKLRCPNDHEWSVSPNKFKGGRRCLYCPKNFQLQAKERFISLVKKNRYNLLGEYINANIKTLLRCPNGHEYEVIPNSFKRGCRCPVCSGQCPIQAEERFIELVKKEKYELLSEYKNAHTKVWLVCDYGHKYKVKPNDFQQGHRCPVCFGGKSKKELKVYEYVKSLLNVDVISGDRTMITNPDTNKSMELDIWIPSLNKAIEFNGIYWHNNNYAEYRDRVKKNQCYSKGIDLMVICEDIFDDSPDKCFYMIDLFLNIKGEVNDSYVST